MEKFQETGIGDCVCMGGGSKDHLSFPIGEFRMQSERPADGRKRERQKDGKRTQRQDDTGLRLSIFVSSLSF